jgi:hypothetical protein
MSSELVSTLLAPGYKFIFTPQDLPTQLPSTEEDELMVEELVPFIDDTAASTVAATGHILDPKNVDYIANSNGEYSLIRGLPARVVTGFKERLCQQHPYVKILAEAAEKTRTSAFLRGPFVLNAMRGHWTTSCQVYISPMDSSTRAKGKFVHYLKSVPNVQVLRDSHSNYDVVRFAGGLFCARVYHRTGTATDDLDDLRMQFYDQSLHSCYVDMQTEWTLNRNIQVFKKRTSFLKIINGLKRGFSVMLSNGQGGFKGCKLAHVRQEQLVDILLEHKKFSV